MKIKIKYIIIGMILLFLIGFGVSQIITNVNIDFDNSLSQSLINKCGSDIQCYMETYPCIDIGDNQKVCNPQKESYPRFYTMIHQDGSIEKVILIEDYPVNITTIVK